MITIKHILITAGGTAEAIDGVRQIRNTSTGSLCVCIYEALAEHAAAETDAAGKSGADFMVHYVVAASAARPEIKERLPVTFYEVTDVKSVKAVLERLLTDQKIDYIIHGMAVSDFSKDYLIEKEELIREITEAVDGAMDDSKSKLNAETLRALIRDVVEHPRRALDSSLKVRSDGELLLCLKRTPKLIELMKKLSPDAFLVGFKLLKGVSEEELVRVAAELSERNGCSLVLANDMNRIQNDRHEGLLLQGRCVVGRYHTKKEIAEGIVRHMLGGDINTAKAYEGGSI